MMRPVVIAFVVAAGLLMPVISSAQQAYSPGQTFTSSSTPAPYSNTNVHRQPEYNLPVQQPVQRRGTQQVPQTVQQPSGAPMYNMGGRGHAQVTQQTVVKPARKSAAKVESASTEVKPKTASTPAMASNTKSENGSSDSKPVAAKTPDTDSSDKAVAAKEDTKASEAPAAAESTDKLVFFSRKTGKKQVALTYDDGPNPAFTPRLAKWLKENNVPATFFVSGNMVKEYPDHVKKLAEDGFELANHTYSHPDLRKLSPEKVTEQLQDTHDVVKEITGIDMNLMRPPYGAHNSKVDAVCQKLGYKIINWDVDTEDWRKRSTAAMLKTIMSKTGDGSIILMHDRKHGGKDSVLETTQQAVEQLRAKGYTFVTVGELLDMPPQSSSTTYVNAVDAPSVPVNPVSSLPIPLVNTAGEVTTTTFNQALPTPAIMTPASIVP